MTSFCLCECSEKSVCHCTSRSRLLRRKIKRANVCLVCVSDGVSSANRQEKLEGEGTRRSNSTGMSDLSETAAAHTLHVIAGRIMGLAINWQAARPPQCSLKNTGRDCPPLRFICSFSFRLRPQNLDISTRLILNISSKQDASGRLRRSTGGGVTRESDKPLHLTPDAERLPPSLPNSCCQFMLRLY